MTKLEALEQKLKILENQLSFKDDEFLDMNQTAAFLKISYYQLQKLAKSGEIPMTRKAGNYRILKSKLIRWCSED